MVVVMEEPAVRSRGIHVHVVHEKKKKEKVKAFDHEPAEKASQANRAWMLDHQKGRDLV
jgi:hypothetical protein